MILPSRVYFIVDPLDTGHNPVELARAMLAGGARLLQLRLKGIATGELVAIARRIRELTTATGAALIINDRVDVALAVEADGVHLGQEDVPVAEARRLLGPDRWIGFSTHSEAQLEAAAGCGTDYLSLGPIFATTSKSAADPVIGCARLRAVRSRVAEPLVAIGGITAATAPEVLAAGVNAVGVIAAVVRAPDVARATAELLAVAGG
ncbi:MAG: thiamine phosphate synthase [Deltaproteobacteria bacterium]|nr:thiamine phosphate synthase [Deltaproteobacteria bacterium]